MAQRCYYRVLGSSVNMVEAHHVHMGAKSAYNDATLADASMWGFLNFFSNFQGGDQGRVHVRRGRVHVRQGRVHVRRGRVHVRPGRVHVRQGRAHVRKSHVQVSQCTRKVRIWAIF